MKAKKFNNIVYFKFIEYIDDLESARKYTIKIDLY
jgi:hypothetical protein